MWRFGSSAPALKDRSASLLPPLTELRSGGDGDCGRSYYSGQKGGIAPKISEDELRQRVLENTADACLHGVGVTIAEETR